MSEPKLRIVLTGFGPFGQHEVNPSWLAVKRAASLWKKVENVELITEEIPVSYDFVLNNVPQKWLEKSESSNKTILVHCGVSKYVNKVNIERQAPNKGYSKPDIEGKVPPCNQCCTQSEDEVLETKLDVNEIVAEINAKVSLGAEVSTCVGDYLCAFVYYKALKSMNNEALFVHVPDLWKNEEDVENLANSLICVLEHIANKYKK